MITSLIDGNKATKLLKDRDFLTAWRKIYTDCPWATLLQSPEYVTSWFDNYDNNYNPIIFIHKTADGDISGLLFLAINKASTHLIMAGHPQFEYQGWVTHTQNLDKFLPDTFMLLGTHYPKHDLEITYLHDSFPIKLLETALKKIKSPFVFIEKHDKPVIKIDKAAIEKSLRSKSRKSKINRMKRMGELSFKKLETEYELMKWLDQIIDCYDFRQKAVHNASPFFIDANKRPYHIELFNKGLLHITALSVDDVLVSVMIGIVSGNELSNSIITHSPFYAKHSPGEIHIKWLALLLAEEGLQKIDLTPGDNWKLRHANKIETVHNVVVFSSRTKRFLHAIKYNSKKWILNIYPDLRHNALTFISKRQKAKTEQQNRAALVRVNNVEHEKTTSDGNLVNDIKIKKNNLHDFLYAVNSIGIRDDFFSIILESLEAGNDVYTATDKEKLIAYCILSNKAETTEIQDVFAETGYSKQGFLERVFRQNGLAM